MTLGLTLVAIAGFATPHALRLRHVTPLTAVVIWVSALSLRVVAVILASAWLLLFFPATRLFAALTHWCWHHVAAAVLNGHDVGHFTTLLPALLGVASLASVVVATVKLILALRRLAPDAGAGGPSGSVIVGGSEVALAVVGLRRPRVLISAGALLELDDDELDAALAHERAHIARRHRYVLVYAELCEAITRLLPGTRAALEELAFHLERDADRWALARPVDRYALAGALRKASGTRALGDGIVLALGTSRVEERLDEILESHDLPYRRSRVWRIVAALLASLCIAIAAAVPPAVAAGLDVVQKTPVAVDCD